MRIVIKNIELDIAESKKQIVVNVKSDNYKKIILIDHKDIKVFNEVK